MKDLFSISAFLEWVEQQPKRKRYDCADSSNCAVAQYAKERGIRQLYDDWENGKAGKWQDTPFLRLIDIAAFGGPSWKESTHDTFGNLAKRLRAE